MKLAIMQPYLFPYIGYFQLINAVDKFVIYDDVNFINKGYINRNRILLNGKPFDFSVPLSKASQNKKIKDTFVHSDGKWKRKLLATVEQAYKKAPFYGSVYPLVFNVFNMDESKITGYVRKSLRDICEYLKIGTEIVWSSEVYGNAELSGEKRIIDICRKESASTYINPIGGKELYSHNSFSNHGIHLHFIESKPINYDQLGREFVSWLSIIDVLMFNSVEDIQAMLQNYSLRPGF